MNKRVHVFTILIRAFESSSIVYYVQNIGVRWDKYNKLHSFDIEHAIIILRRLKGIPLLDREHCAN